MAITQTTHDEPKHFSGMDALLYCILIVGPQALNGLTMEMFKENRLEYIWTCWVLGDIISIAGAIKAYRSGREIPPKKIKQPSQASPIPVAIVPPKKKKP